MRPEGPRQSGAYGWLPSYRPGPRMTERAYPISRHSELRCSDKCLRSLAKDIRERAHVGWLRELNAKEPKTTWGCFGGWSLDAFDVQMYSFVIPTVISLWGLSHGEAGLIGTVTLLISSLGGWFSGTLADKFGRVRMLQITILWYSIFTFLCAFAQNFEQLFVLRALH